MIFTPLTDLGQLVTECREAQAGGEVLQQILAKPIDKAPKQPRTLEKLKKINLKNVDFIYQSSKDPPVKRLTDY